MSPTGRPPPFSDRESSSTIASLQVLRFIAALGVAVSHAADMLAKRATEIDASSTSQSHWSHGWHTGTLGVDVFFVISGFIMGHIVTNKPTTPESFLSRRLIRIFPIFWVASSVSLVFLVLFSPTNIPSLGSIVRSLLLIPELAANGRVRPSLLGQGWTLYYELYFYGLFALFLRLAPLRRLALLALALFAGRAMSWVVPVESTAHEFLDQNIVFEFLFGAAIAAIPLQRCSGWIPWTIVSVSIAAIAIVQSSRSSVEADPLRFIFWGIPAAAIVAGVTVFDSLRFQRFPSLLVQLGNSSYALYLVHVFPLLAFAALWKRNLIPHHTPLALCFVALMFIIVALGWAVHRFVERPLLRRLQGDRQASRAQTHSRLSAT